MINLNFVATIGSFQQSIVFAMGFEIDRTSLEFKNFLRNLSFDLRESEASASELTSMRILIRQPGAGASNRGRLIRFSDGSWIAILSPLRLAEISSHLLWADLAELLESWVGLRAEQTGILRFHALAFEESVSKRGPLALMVAESGFGKSTLALKMPERVWADEVCYVKGELLLNDRLTIRLKESDGEWVTRHGRRQLVTVRGQEVKTTGSLDSIPSGKIIGRVYLGSTRVRASPKSFRARLRWCWSVFWGLGLPQFIRYSVFISTLPVWAKVAVRRFGAVLKLQSKFGGVLTRSDFEKTRG